MADVISPRSQIRIASPVNPKSMAADFVIEITLNRHRQSLCGRYSRSARISAAMAALATQANLMMTFGVPLTDVVNLLCELACDLVSAVEPAQLRQNVISEMVKNLPGIVDRHYQARHTTPSGLIVP